MNNSQNQYKKTPKAKLMLLTKISKTMRGGKLRSLSQPKSSLKLEKLQAKFEKHYISRKKKEQARLVQLNKKKKRNRIRNKRHR